MPGNESDGNGVFALVKLTPLWTRSARAEPGRLATYQPRSVWCRPSTEIRITCCTGLERAAAPVDAMPTPTAAAVRAPTAETRRTGVKRISTPPPAGRLRAPQGANWTLRPGRLWAGGVPRIPRLFSGAQP